MTPMLSNLKRPGLQKNEPNRTRRDLISFEGARGMLKQRRRASGNTGRTCPVIGTGK